MYCSQFNFLNEPNTWAQTEVIPTSRIVKTSMMSRQVYWHALSGTRWQDSIYIHTLDKTFDSTEIHTIWVKCGQGDVMVWLECLPWWSTESAIMANINPVWANVDNWRHIPGQTNFESMCIFVNSNFNDQSHDSYCPDFYIYCKTLDFIGSSSLPCVWWWWCLLNLKLFVGSTRHTSALLCLPP